MSVDGLGGRFSSGFRPELGICSTEGLFFLAGMSSSSQSVRSYGTLVRFARGVFCVLQSGWSEPRLENPFRPAIASLYC